MIKIEKNISLEIICKIQRKIVKSLLIFNIITLLGILIYISINNTKVTKMQIELTNAQHKIDILTSSKPEVQIEFLKPIEDYSKEDIEKYHLPPLPKTMKL